MSTLENCRSQAAYLEDLLSVESNHLKAGDLQNLLEMSDLKAQALSSLLKSVSQLTRPVDVHAITPDVEKIKKTASQNGLMFKTIMNGVKSARDRLNSLQHANAKIGAYNRVGAKLYLSEDQIISEKRI